jgi:cellobiose-specific phosphotransferase system component IIC
MFWALLAHFSLPNANAKGRKIRVVGMFISLISYVVMTQSVIRAVKDLEKYGLEQDTIFTLNSIQSAVDVAAIAEYGLFIGLITALYSFEFDFGKKSEESE